MLRHVARLAAMILVVTAASLVLPTSAEAATCGSSHGVSVVVDFHQLGAGVQTFCDAGGAGEYAARQFEDAGHTLTRVSTEPGFVCRVDGSPSSDPCQQTPPTDAYWSLWWSDGTSGTWKYSSIGVDSLKVPDGGSVALSWQGQTAQAGPRAAPPRHASSSATPTPSPTQAPPRHARHRAHHASAGPTTTPSSPSASAVPRASSSPPGPTPSATRAAHAAHHSSTPRAHHASHRPSAGTSAAQADQAPVRATTPATSAGSGSGLPGWLAPVLVALVFVAGGVVTVVRRRRSGGA